MCLQKKMLAALKKSYPGLNACLWADGGKIRFVARDADDRPVVSEDVKKAYAQYSGTRDFDDVLCQLGERLEVEFVDGIERMVAKEIEAKASDVGGINLENVSLDDLSDEELVRLAAALMQEKVCGFQVDAMPPDDNHDGPYVFCHSPELG